MKIILSQQEAQQFVSMTRILGAVVDVSDKSFITVTNEENGNIVLNVAEDFVCDIFGFVSTMTPVVKAVYAHIVSSFTLLKALGQNLEEKWSKQYPVESKEQEVV